MTTLQFGQARLGCKQFTPADLVDALLLGLLLGVLGFWSLVPGNLFAVSRCRVMLELLADIRGQEAETIADAAFSNAKSLFSFSSQ